MKGEDNKSDAEFISRCRRCGVEYDSRHAGTKIPKWNYRISLMLDIFRGREKSCQLLGIHFCDDSYVGVSDFIGMRKL